MNKLLTFYANTQTQGDDGYVTQTEDDGVNISASIKEMDGYRKSLYGHLVNDKIYEAICYDHASIEKDARVVYGSQDLRIIAMSRNYNGSFTNKVKLILRGV